LIRIILGMSLRIYNLTEAARKIGVAPITLKRWLLSHKVAEVSRDRNGWRVFTAVDIRRIQRYASARRAPGRR
jgi:DNA-binding transcriptional MerR regulator